MKNITLLSSLLVVGMLATTQAMAVNCGLNTLKGSYIYHVDGVLDGKPYAEAGQETYDGKGNITNTYATNQASSSSSITGTYTIDANCNGTSTYSNGSVYKFSISPKGDLFTFVKIGSPTSSVAGSETRVSR